MTGVGYSVTFKSKQINAVSYDVTELIAYMCSRNLPPPKVKRRRGNVYAKLTLIMFPDVTLLQENI